MVNRADFEIWSFAKLSFVRNIKKMRLAMPGYPTESSYGRTGFFISNNISFFKGNDLTIASKGMLESTFY